MATMKYHCPRCDRDVSKRAAVQHKCIGAMPHIPTVERPSGGFWKDYDGRRHREGDYVPTYRRTA